HAAHRKNLTVWTAAIGRKQSRRHHRVGKLFRGGIKCSIVRLGRSLLAARRLKDGLQINRHGMTSGGNDIFLMHVVGSEAVKYHNPAPAATEKGFELVSGGTAGMLNTFRPSVAVARQRACRFQFDG